MTELNQINNKKMKKAQISIEFEVPENFYKDKKDNFRFSRFALRKFITEESLEIENHTNLKANKNIKVSLSHTKGAGCAMTLYSELNVNIGIDIEWNDRKYTEEIRKFFINEDDDTNLSTLETWCVKEATFKAYHPIYNGEKNLILKDFKIKNKHIYFNQIKLGTFSILYKSYNKRTLIVASVIIRALCP